MIGLQSCHKEKISIIGNYLDFKAVNLSASENDQIDANGSGTVITTTLNLTLTINGEATLIKIGRAHV